MTFLELAKKRYSVRSFSERKVEKEKIEMILEAGRIAPTACNRQPQRIIVAESEEALAKLKKCTECHYNAPVALIICADKSDCWTRSYDGKQSDYVDASIVTTYMMLEATDLGIGSTWIMYFDPAATREEFDIPANYEPVSILVMGYPADNAKPSASHGERKASAETTEFR